MMKYELPKPIKTSPYMDKNFLNRSTKGSQLSRQSKSNLRLPKLPKTNLPYLHHSPSKKSLRNLKTNSRGNSFGNFLHRIDGTLDKVAQSVSKSTKNVSFKNLITEASIDFDLSKMKSRNTTNKSDPSNKFFHNGSYLTTSPDTYLKNRTANRLTSAVAGKHNIPRGNSTLG